MGTVANTLEHIVLLAGKFTQVSFITLIMNMLQPESALVLTTI